MNGLAFRSFHWIRESVLQQSKKDNYWMQGQINMAGRGEQTNRMPVLFLLLFFLFFFNGERPFSCCWTQDPFPTNLYAHVAGAEHVPLYFVFHCVLWNVKGKYYDNTATGFHNLLSIILLWTLSYITALIIVTYD